MTNDHRIPTIPAAMLTAWLLAFTTATYTILVIGISGVWAQSLVAFCTAFLVCGSVGFVQSVRIFAHECFPGVVRP